MQQTATYLLKMLQSGKINPDEYEYSLKDKLDLDQELVLLFEVRYKNELKTAGLKIAELMSKNVDFKTQIWNDECQVSLL